MTRYLCLHGHFYQPPRENPWLEAIELQDSAAPFHDWNERITHECYAPNAASRILDRSERIESIVNNYSGISFNFGPTLLAWLERGAPEVHAALIEADRVSRERHGGHGNALAQAHGHLILPLADPRDRRTQVVWGVRDFVHRFGRAPEGMWLPETAVDGATLEELAAADVRFTVLAPHQARRVRPLGDGAWTDLQPGTIDPTRAYQARLPSGRSLALFFYDGPLSRAIAFERLLDNGWGFAARLLGAFSPGREHAQLVHVATDGETYGHHHRHGDMALAWSLRHLEAEDDVRLTNYGEFLEHHPPQWEVEIAEATAWSCAHGVERWRSDCGCASGSRPGWHQKWRAPLREALDWLRDRIRPGFESAAGALFRDPWTVRDEYIDVVLDRSPASVDGFLRRHAGRELGAAEQVRALQLLELQRHAMAMYTSCGWFFDDISGIETVQVLSHAARVVQLAEDLHGEGIDELFRERLALAPGNVPELGDGRQVYERLIHPVGMAMLAAHYGVSALFHPFPEAAGEPAPAVAAESAPPAPSRMFCFAVTRERFETWSSGRARLVLGRAAIASEVTRESARAVFAALHFGDHNLTAGVGPAVDDPGFDRIAVELSEAFALADLPELIAVLRRHFGERSYSLKTLFRDEQRLILDSVLRATLTEVEEDYRRIHRQHAPLLRFLASLGVPIPRPLRSAAQVVLAADLRHAIAGEVPDLERIDGILTEAREHGVTLDGGSLGHDMRRVLERRMDALVAAPFERERIAWLERAVGMVAGAGLGTDLWVLQNRFVGLRDGVLPGARARAEAGEADAGAWVTAFAALGARLRVKVG